MKLEILQEELLGGLTTVLRAVSARVQLPVLSYVLMEADKSGIGLSGADLEIGIRVKVMGKVEEGFTTAVPGKMLAEFLGTLPPGKVTVELKEKSLIITAGGYEASFQTMDPTEFPKLPEFGGRKGKINNQAIEEAINGVVFASAKDSLRPVLTGVLMELGKKLKLVATDGFRLAVENIEMGEGGESEIALVPSRVLAELPRMMKEEEIEIGLLPETHQIMFRGGSTLLISQLLEGNFPDYQKILPKEFTTEVKVGKEELLSAVRMTHIFARENSNMMRWEVGAAKIVITSSSPEKGECRVEVPAKIEGGEVGVVFNAKYVMDYLAGIAGENIWIGLGDKLSPGMFREEGDKNGLYVVMPINV